MRTTITALFLAASMHLMAQVPSGSGSQVAEYAFEHLGEKVGKGICFNLVKKAFEVTDKNWYETKWEHKSKFKIEQSEISEGDVILFSGAQFEDGYKTGFHVAIVFSVEGPGKVTIAEQNICDGSEKKEIRAYGQTMRVCEESEVALRSVDLGSLQKGKITFYRF